MDSIDIRHVEIARHRAQRYDVVAARGLTAAQVAERVAAGRVNDVPVRASRSVWEIVRANVFTRINAILAVLFAIVMSTGFFLAYGSYDKASNSYTYHGSMDDPMAPKTSVPVRAVVHIVDPSHYTFDWYETRGGKESRTMQIEYSK